MPVPADPARQEREHRRAAARRRRRQRRVPAVLALAVAAGLLAYALSGSSPRRPARARLRQTPVARTVAPARPGATAALLRLPAQLPQRTVAVPILMYHRIGRVTPAMPPITRALTVAPGVFAAQMEWLKAHGFHAITQRQLYAALERGAGLPARPIMITFDDGYRDVLWNAAPVLSRLHLPATAYIITDRVSGPDPSFLTWPELVNLERHGVEIGSHTVHHWELTLLPSSVAQQELVLSRATLERHLGHPVQWFAYPAGAEDARIVPLVRQAGYVLAVTTHGGDQQSAQHPFELHRDEVLRTTGVGGLAAMLGG